VVLRYEIRSEPDEWTLPEEPVPESRLHDLVIDHLKALLSAWAARAGREVMVARNLAIRWVRERPQIGVDPDLCLIEPPPPEGDALRSLQLWQPGHCGPVLAVEVVSLTHPSKDYGSVQDRYAACGAGELWVFDPLLAGPRVNGGPFALQLWRRSGEELERIYAGPGPARSPAVDGWLLVTGAGKTLQICADPQGAQPWLTELEAERAQKEQALQRVRELEAQLQKLKGG